MLKLISRFFKYLSENEVQGFIAVFMCLIGVAGFIFQSIQFFKPSETDVAVRRELETLCVNYKNEIQNKRDLIKRNEVFAAMQEGASRWNFISDSRWLLSSINPELKTQFNKIKNQVDACMKSGGQLGDCELQIDQELDTLIKLLNK